MPSAVPTPVAAAIGLVPTFLGGVRRLPGRAVRLPVHAVGHVLTTVGSAKREYDALAVRGEELISKLRGTSFDEVEDAVEDALQDTPFAKPYDVVEDALEDAGEAVTQLMRSGRDRARAAAGTAAGTAASAAATAGRGAEQAAEAVADTITEGAATAGRAAGQAVEAVADGAASATRTAGQAVEAVADGTAAVADAVQPDAGASAADDETVQPAAGPLPVEAAVLAGLDLPAGSPLAALDGDTDTDGTTTEVPDAEAPKGVPTPKATEPDSTRIDTAASAEVVDVVERVSATVGGPVLEHGDLPLPDYDHMTLGSLRGRMRSLDLPQLIQIRDYEKAHADRLPIVTMLDNRIAKLANDPTAPLSGGSADADVPAKGKRAKGGSKVKPTTAHDAASSPDIAFGGLGGPQRGD
jgi:hypothetical protein